MAKKIWLSSFLLVVLLVSSIYFVFNNGSNQFKVDIQNTRTQYYVFENNSHIEKIQNGTIDISGTRLEPIYENITLNENGTSYIVQNLTGYDNISYTETIPTYETNYIKDEGWSLAATEYVYLYEGTTKMRASSRNLTYWNDTNFAYVKRTSNWKDNITTKQTYTFGINEDKIENVPTKNEFECINCEDKIVQYEIRDITYDGETKEIDSPFSFGKNMNLEWQDGSYYSKVFQQKYASDKIIIKYKPTSDYEKYDVRLYDPWWNETWLKCKNINLSFSGKQDGVANLSLTGLTFSSVNEVRIVNTSCGGDGSELNRTIISNTSNSVVVRFGINGTDSVNYSVYYDAIGVGSPNEYDLVNFTSEPTVTPTTTGSGAGTNYGVNFLANDYYTLSAVTLFSECQYQDVCALAHYVGGEVYEITSMSNDVAQFEYQLIPDHYYSITCNKSDGGSTDFRYLNTGASYPYLTDEINYTSAVNGVNTTTTWMIIDYLTLSLPIINTTLILGDEQVSEDTIPPYFTEISNQSIYANQSLNYTFYFDDETAGDSCSIDDTTNFTAITINATACQIVNITGLSRGTYKNKNITINDTSNNLNSTLWKLDVLDIIPTILFVSPTPDNASNQTNTDIYVNYTLTYDTGSAYSFINFDDSLVGWWRFDNDSSVGENSTLVYDWSGNGNNGTFIYNGTGGLISNGSFGGAGYFDADGDWVVLDPSIDINSNYEYTISVWLKKAIADSTSTDTFMSKIGGANNIFYIRATSNDLIQFTVYNESGSVQTAVGTPSNSVQDTNWHHTLIRVWNVGAGIYNYSVWLDGIEYEVRTMNGLPSSGSSADFKIGADWFTNSPFNGSLDEVLILDMGLSDEEIVALYNASSTYHNFTNLGSGNHTFTTYVVDENGNLNYTEERNVDILDVIPPYFITIPSNNSIEYGVGWSGVNFDADDETSFGTYAVNDSRFTINSSGFLNCTGQLGVGSYYPNITINDSSNNINSTVYNLTIYKNSSLVISASGTSPITYPTITDASGSGCPDELTCAFDKDNLVYGVADSPVTFNYSTAGNENYTSQSDTVSITINQNDSLVLGISGTSPIEYPATTDVAGSACPSELSCALNIPNAIYGVGESPVSFNYSTSGNENYTAKSISTDITINQNSSLVLGLTGTTPVGYGNTTDFTGSGCPDELSCSLNISNGIYGAGNISANYSTEGNENYTSKSSIFTINITKANGLVYTYINNSRANLNIEGNNSFWLNSSLQSGEGIIKLFNNGTLINSGTSPIFNYTSFDTPFLYNITTIYEETENYTSSSETWFLNFIIIPEFITSSVWEDDFEDVSLNDTLWQNYTTTTSLGDSVATAFVKEYNSSDGYVDLFGKVVIDVGSNSATAMAVLRGTFNFNTGYNYAINLTLNSSLQEGILKLEMNNGTNLTSAQYGSIDPSGVLEISDLNMFTSKSSAYLFINTSGNVSFYYSNGTIISSRDVSNLSTWYVQFRTGLGSSVAEATYENHLDIFNFSVLSYPLNTSLTSPINYYNSSSNQVYFNCSCIFTEGCTNVSLIIDGIYNNSVVNYTSNQQYLEFYDYVNLAEGNHNWTCNGSSTSLSSTPIPRNLTIDTTDPTIDIIYPLNLTYLIDEITELNYTYFEINPNTCWMTSDNGATNQTIACGSNFTGLSSIEGSNTWIVYINDSVNHVSSDSVNFSYNSNHIIFSENATAQNISANFSIQDFIFSQVYVSETNKANITFNLYNEGGIIQSYNFTNQTKEYNFTGLSNNDYLFNVTACYNDTHLCYNTGERYYGNRIINLSMDGFESNLNVELGTPINLSSSINYDNISFDIVHPSYGLVLNKTYWNATLNLVINYFNKKTFSDGSNNKTFTGYYLNGSTYENLSSLNFTAHQYDYVKNLSFNISGTGTRDISFYNVNSSNISRSFYGYLNGSLINVKTLWDTSNGTNLRLNSTNLSFDNYGEKLIYMYVDDNAKIDNFTLNVTGYKTGFKFNDTLVNNTYEDAVLSDTRNKFGCIIPKGENLSNFIIDDFEDGSINTTKWTKTDDVNYDCVSGDCYDYQITNTETNGYLSLNTHMTPDVDPDESASNNYNNYLTLNPNESQVISSEEYLLEFSITASGTEDDTEDNCYYYDTLYVGGKSVYSIEPSVCQDYTCSLETLKNITVNLSYYNLTSYKVIINGTDRFNGNRPIYDTYTITRYWDLMIQVNSETGNSSLESIFYITIDDFTTWGNAFYFHQYSQGYDEKGSSTGSCSGAGIICADAGCEYGYYCSAASNQATCEDPLYGYYSGTCTWNVGSASSYGCDELTNNIKVYNTNQSKYALLNSTYFSKSIFDSGAYVTLLTFNETTSGNVSNYISTDNGDNYQNIVVGTETPIINPGKHVKWKSILYGEGFGYSTYIPFITDVYIYNEGDVPSNIWFDFGNDGTTDASISGDVNVTNNGTLNVDLSSADLTTAFTSEDPSVGEHTYLVPLEVHSDTAGLIEISGINLTYDPNPVFINKSFIQTFLSSFTNFGNFSILMGAENTSATSQVNVSDVNYNYAGGNQTFEILAHNDNYTKNITRNITYYFSQWDYNWNPSGVEWIYFNPKLPTSKNVSAYGQTSSVSLMNVSNLGYGGKNSTLSALINSSLTCVNTTMSLTSNKSDGIVLNTSFQNLTNSTYLDIQNIWLWSDYNCNYSNYYLYNPSLYFLQCCDGCICSQEVI